MDKHPTGTDSGSFDEEWYLSQYADVRRAIDTGQIDSALSHYRHYGRFEKRLPVRPVVNDLWYLLRYPDVSRAVCNGSISSSFDHFVKWGYAEGRKPLPDGRRWRWRSLLRIPTSFRESGN